SFFLAKRNEAEVTGIAILDKPGIEKSVGPVGPGGSHYAKELREHHEDEALEKIDNLLKTFNEKCESAGVIHKTEEEQGSPSKRLIDLSIYYDLLIMGFKANYTYGEKDTVKTMDKVIDNSVTPVLAVPERFKAPTGKLNALIAFNGSQPSARSMHRFATMFDPTQFSVTVLVSNENLDAAHYYLNKAESFLSGHGFKDVEKKATFSSIIDIVNKEYYTWADLFVCGVHSRSELMTFFVGSLAKNLIEKGEKAVFFG
ncbi:hypothetical protein ACFL67_04605, partial [candidate division KSB1 bacterium]